MVKDALSLYVFLCYFFSELSTLLSLLLLLLLLLSSFLKHFLKFVQLVEPVCKNVLSRKNITRKKEKKKFYILDPLFGAHSILFTKYNP